MGFGARLKKIRKAVKMTQHELSKASGVSQPMICCYEREGSEPKFDTVIRIAKALKIDPGDLAFGEKKKILAGDAASFTGLSIEACNSLRKMDKEALEFFDKSIRAYKRSA